jgi:hypothetical protein
MPQVNSRELPQARLQPRLLEPSKVGGFLLVNRRNRTIKVVVESARAMASVETIDESGVSHSGGFDEALPLLRLRPFAVAISPSNRS